ncbi:hypothetical protein ACUS6C_04225 [Pseudomonas aeruginosa]
MVRDIKSINSEKAVQKTFQHGRALYVDDDLYACLQFDFIRLDVVVCDEHGTVLGRPVLTASLNPATQECAGWDVSMGTPCAEKLVSVVKQAITGAPGTPGCGGKIRAFNINNGAEMVSSGFRNIANTLGISIRHIPPGQPNANAFIERFFWTVDFNFVQMLPATTKEALEALGDYKPKQHANLTLSQLRKKFRKWLEIYHSTYHQALYMSPHQKRKALIKKCPSPERYTAKDLTVLGTSAKSSRP